MRLLDRYRGRGYVEPWRRLADAARIPAGELALYKRLLLGARIASITLRLFPKQLPPHTDRQLYVFVDTVLQRPGVPGVIVEAGAFKGISTAKISQVAATVGRRLGAAVTGYGPVHLSSSSRSTTSFRSRHDISRSTITSSPMYPGHQRLSASR